MTPSRAITVLLFLAGIVWTAVLRPDAPVASHSAGSSDITAFVGVGVLPMDDSELRHHDWTVVVEGRRIAAAGPRDQVPVADGAYVIEGGGRWLLPGLAEMHAHIPDPRGVGEAQMTDLLFLYLAQGVTTIRSMLGAPGHPEFRSALDQGDPLGPNLVAASPSLSGESTPDPEAAADQVRAAASDGFDLLKLHPGLSRESYDAMVRTARAERITWAGHLSRDVPLEHALETGISTIDHLDGFLEAVASVSVQERLAAGEAVPLAEVVESATSERIRQVARTTRDHGVWNVPTLHLWETFYGDSGAEELAERPELRYVHSALRDHWVLLHRERHFVALLEGWRTDGMLGAADVPPEAGQALVELRREVLRALHDAGAPLLLGTDSPQLFMVPGFATHREIALWTEVGIPAKAILEAATRNVGVHAAEDLGQDEPFGTVTVGSRADLLLVDDDPLDHLDTLRDPAGVMVRGHWLDRERIRGELDAIAERASGATGEP